MTMIVLRLRLLGGLAAEREGQGVPVSIQPRRLAVLALIAESRERGIGRPNLQALLWPDSDEESGRRALNQAVYALKRDTGAEDLFLETRELRLNPSLVSVDLWEFDTALAAGDHERAVRAYAGTFLDGFRLPNAAEFERWADDRRTAIEHRANAAIEHLAVNRRSAGDHAGAVASWRLLASRDPLNGRIALELMRELAAAGDRAAAIQHARIYERLVETELEMKPDPPVVSFAESLRATDAGSVPPRADVQHVAVESPLAAEGSAGSDSQLVEVQSSPVEAASPQRSSSMGDGQALVASSRQRRRLTIIAGGGILAAGLIVGAVVSQRTGALGTAPIPSLLAVGEVTDYRGGEDSTLARPLADMLATNLARLPTTRVLSTARMMELIRQLSRDDIPRAGLTTAAARRAGAQQLVDGAVFQLADGTLRLDLRRIDLDGGDVLAAYTVHGTDAFSLADSATALLAHDLGTDPPRPSIADVTTRSLAAYRLYERGLRAYSGGDKRTAEPLFEAAVAEDSMFALATYYYALSGTAEHYNERLARAARLAETAPDRERLILKAGVAYRNSDPLALAYADTLAVRYPDEVDGHLHRGLALLNRAEHTAAIPSLRRVVDMDSLALRGEQPRCAACDALRAIVLAYIALDSAAAAVREARAWTRVQPGFRLPWEGMLSASAASGQSDAVFEAAKKMAEADPSFLGDPAGPAYRWLPADQPERAESELRRTLVDGTPAQRASAYWFLTLALREQGRYSEGLEYARRYRALFSVDDWVPAMAVAQALRDIGQFRAAAALFDTAASRRSPDESDTRNARHTAWAMTLAGDALATAGDTTRILERADRVREIGAQSSLCRDPLLHLYLRGLLLQLRNDHEAASRVFRDAICTTTLGYTRMNLALARSLLALRRAPEAVTILQPALRGLLEGSNYYTTRAEAHELLAEAWDQAGQRDSATAHYRVVARLWARADAPLQPRVARARERVSVLERAARP